MRRLLLWAYLVLTTLCTAYLVIGTHIGNGLVGWPL